MFAVGYGNMIPIGPVRFFTIIQSALGMLLPTAYFTKALDSLKDD
ncbi:ion channel [Oceanobacillus piezotolerans]